MKITGTETIKFIIDRIERHLKDAKEVSFSTEADTKEIPGGVERNGVMCEAFETTGTTYINLVIKKEEEDEQEPEPDNRKQREIEYEERINQLEREKEQFICHIWELEYKLAEDMFRKTTAEIIDAAEIDTKEELIWGLKAFIIHMIPGALVVLAFLLGHFG